jgi:MFS superfamily sulfate permease-like transporter
MRDLVIPALNLALVSFVSLMLTARSFAAKNGYEINADAVPGSGYCEHYVGVISGVCYQWRRFPDRGE